MPPSSSGSGLSSGVGSVAVGMASSSFAAMCSQTLIISVSPVRRTSFAGLPAYHIGRARLAGERESGRNAVSLTVRL